MTSLTLQEEIKQKDVDIEKLSHIILYDEYMRDSVVTYAVDSQEIMLYYNSYYIVDDASQKSPMHFYEYWDQFAALLYDENSYKRDIGMTIIANLTPVDEENKFDDLYNQYISLINDKKFMTAECCINNLAKILPHKKHLIDTTVETLLQIENKTTYTDKQTAVLKSNVIEVFTAVFEQSKYQSEILVFISGCLDSISPKTRKTAKQALAKLT